MRPGHASVCCSLLIGTLAMLAVASEGQELIRATNGRLQIGFDRGRGDLAEVIDVKAGHNHVGQVQDAAGLWQLEFLAGAEKLTVCPADAGSFRCEPIGGLPPALRLIWERFPGALRLRVEVTVRVEPEQPLSRWEIRVGGLEQQGLRQVRFPRLLNLPRQEPERLAVPLWMGQQTAAPRRLLSSPEGRGLRQEWTYPGLLSMQCLAFYQPGGPGLYVACDDAAAFGKAFACFGDGQGNISCELTHFPEHTGRPNGDWALPYAVLVGTFAGDWVTAAEQYRAWATNQAWARESRLQRGLVPDWVTNTGLWVWNRGRSEQVLTPARALQEELGLPVSVFWHWWHGCAYDTGFPDYLPPREGAEPFKAALASAHAQDLHALVYMNQRLWGMSTRSWREEGAEAFAVKGADGKVRPEVYNTFTRQPCATMCLGTEFWRRKYAGLVEQAVRELGVDGIYMDQACTSLACYDSAHGHPLGGGTYWMHGFRTMSEDIRQRCQGPVSKAGIFEATRWPARQPMRARLGLAGEGCGEAWLPYLDLMLSLQVSKERYAGPDGWEPIPFFHAVYHPYAVTYGNYSSLTMPPYDELWPGAFAPQEPLQLLDRKFSRQFCLEQARAFVWGQQPTLANFLPAHLEQRSEEMEFVMRLARLRSRATKYLLHGTFLRPPKLQVPEATLDLSRLSIYAGQQGGLTTYQRPYALAVAGSWRAPDGTVAIALASVAGEPLRLSLPIDAEYYRLPKRAKVYRLDETGRTPMGRWGKITAPLVLDLPARGACLLEFE